MSLYSRAKFFLRFVFVREAPCRLSSQQETIFEVYVFHFMNASYTPSFSLYLRVKLHSRAAPAKPVCFCVQTLDQDTFGQRLSQGAGAEGCGHVLRSRSVLNSCVVWKHDGELQHFRNSSCTLWDKNRLVASRSGRERLSVESGGGKPRERRVDPTLCLSAPFADTKVQQSNPLLNWGNYKGRIHHLCLGNGTFCRYGGKVKVIVVEIWCGVLWHKEMQIRLSDVDRAIFCFVWFQVHK